MALGAEGVHQLPMDALLPRNRLPSPFLFLITLLGKKTKKANVTTSVGMNVAVQPSGFSGVSTKASPSVHWLRPPPPEQPAALPVCLSARGCEGRRVSELHCACNIHRILTVNTIIKHSKY